MWTGIIDVSGLFSKTHQLENKNKPCLVLLHGWGAHSGVWQSVLPALVEDYNVICIDLPGHGHSAGLSQNSIEDWAKAVLEVAPDKAIWLGWSLGGLVAQQVAIIAPDRVEKLILVASTPCFIKSTDWTNAVDEKIFKDFHAEVVRDSHASLLRFIALQTRGSNTASQDGRLLRKTLLQPEPSSAALDLGMQLLLKTDLRNALKKIISPVLFIAGERDTLVPCSILKMLDNIYSNVEKVAIKQAGHAPFLSHTQQFCKSINDFCFKGTSVHYKEAK